MLTGVLDDRPSLESGAIVGSKGSSTASAVVHHVDFSILAWALLSLDSIIQVITPPPPPPPKKKKKKTTCNNTYPPS